MVVQAEWPIEIEAKGPLAAEEGGSLDKAALQSLRSELARDARADSATQSDNALKPEITSSSSSFGLGSITTSAAHSTVDCNGSAGPRTGVQRGPMQDIQTPNNSRSRTGGQERAGLQTDSDADGRDGPQGAEWQLSSISQKALRIGRSRSSSLVRPNNFDVQQKPLLPLAHQP